MGLKAQKVNQFRGFGNDSPKRRGEYYSSAGMTRGRYGVLANKSNVDFFDTGDFAGLGVIKAITSGLGRDNPSSDTSGEDPVVYFSDDEGKIFSSADGTGAVYQAYDGGKNANMFAGKGNGLITDQKGRLLFVGDSHIGKFDPSVTDDIGSGTFTNASGTVTGSGFTTGGAWDGKLIRVLGLGSIKYYRINSVVSATEIDLFGNFEESTGSYSFTVLTSWTEEWKSLGTALAVDPVLGDQPDIPTERYEGTVLFGVNNRIVTLDVDTDTVATSAFTMPADALIKQIKAGSNGILIGCNMHGQGLLVLWDNYSDRSIADWIWLNDPIVSMDATDKGNWIVQTEREIFVSNGYTIEPMMSDFLNQNIYPSSHGLNLNTMLATGNDCYFNISAGSYTKTKLGLYKMYINDQLLEYIPDNSLDSINSQVTAIHRDPYSGRLFVAFTGNGNKLTYIRENTPSTVSSYVTNDLGLENTKKTAEGLWCDLEIGDASYTEQAITFDLVAKISNLDRQPFDYALVKTTQANADEIVVDETVYGEAQVGDEIEFLEGNNAGQTRNITSIAGGNTATATYTLDRDLPALADANDTIVRTKFRLIGIKSFSAETELPRDIYFNIKNHVKGRKYQVKLEIINPSLPIEIKPFIFIYDDLGTI